MSRIISIFVIIAIFVPSLLGYVKKSKEVQKSYEQKAAYSTEMY